MDDQNPVDSVSTAVDVEEMFHRTICAWGLKRLVTRQSVRRHYGRYLLLLRIPAMTIRIGMLGPIVFATSPDGIYGYVGSASGGSITLAHRLTRHYNREKTPRWHIDYLTSHPAVDVVGAYISTDPHLTEERLATLCVRRFVVVRNFGNSDNRGKTPGHLFLLSPHSFSANTISQYALGLRHKNNDYPVSVSYSDAGGLA